MRYTWILSGCLLAGCAGGPDEAPEPAGGESAAAEENGGGEASGGAGESEAAAVATASNRRRPGLALMRAWYAAGLTAQAARRSEI